MHFKTDPNASVNPVTDETTMGQAGLTKREYFAGLAIAGLATGNLKGEDYVPIVIDAVRLADMLIAELNKDLF